MRRPPGSAEYSDGGVIHARRVPTVLEAGELPGLPGLLREADRLMWSGAPQEAIAILEQSRTMASSTVERYAVGLSLLRASNGLVGWDLYDLHPSEPADRLPTVHRWDGEPCRLLIVVAEQGFGDAIQFLRFVPQVATLAESVVVAVHDELLDITSSSPLMGSVSVIGKSAARRWQWPADARWERLMSLPAKIKDLRIEAAEPYIRVDPRVRPFVSLHPLDMLTVGVAWRSTPRRGFPSRSFPAHLLQRLAAPGRVRLVALHRDSDIRAAPKTVEMVGIRNLLDTVHVISRCDYVVTADTVTAHLGPAVGVPTFVCLRHRADWRWGTPANPTRWYRDAELLFQDESQRWKPVLDAAAQRIADSSASQPAPQDREGTTHERAE